MGGGGRVRQGGGAGGGEGAAQTCFTFHSDAHGTVRSAAFVPFAPPLLGSGGVATVQVRTPGQDLMSSSLLPSLLRPAPHPC